MQYIAQNWETIVALIVAIHGVALLVVNLTPTPKDDEILAKGYRVLELVAGLFSAKAKQPFDK
jgi:hypothetical protein